MFIFTTIQGRKFVHYVARVCTDFVVGDQGYRSNLSLWQGVDLEGDTPVDQSSPSPSQLPLFCGTLHSLLPRMSTH